MKTREAVSMFLAFMFFVHIVGAKLQAEEAVRSCEEKKEVIYEVENP